MRLSKDSAVTRLYKWFYNTESLPMNLCPYFWKLVFMWLVIIPYFILVLPSFIIERMSNEKTSFENGDRRTVSFASYAAIILLISIGCFISGFFIEPEKNSLYESFWLIGSLVSGVILGGLLVLLFKWIYDKLTYKHYIPYSERLPKKDSIIKEFFKAKKEKYCPRIDWE